MAISIKNLLKEPGRFLISIGGVAFALLLILVLGGVFAGTERQATAFMNDSGVDVWVMQKGVSNMHMATSMMPESRRKEISRMDHVETVSQILYTSGALKINDKKTFSFIVGFDPSEETGGPWKMAEGKTDIDSDEVIIDEALAKKRGVEIGDEISVLGKKLTIAGLSVDTFSLANTIAFIKLSKLEKIMRARKKKSYFLVKLDDPKNRHAVAKKIKNEVTNVNTLTTAAFVASDKQMIKQMGVGIINAMSTIGFIIGIMVVGLTIFTATLDKSRDYGVLKAIGASRYQLYRIVFEQSVICVVLGFFAGWLLALGTKAAVEYYMPEIELLFSSADIVRAGAAMILIAILASYIPIRRIAGIDPMIVFKS